MTVAVAIDLSAVDRTGPSGAVWSLPHGGDLDANVVVLAAGTSIGAHVNESVDVVFVIVEGGGVLDVDAERHEVSAGMLVHVPKGTRRALTAGAEALLYITVHRARDALGIGGRPPIDR